MSSTLNYIPQIWADTVTESLIQGLYASVEQWKAETAAHEQRLASDPDYARAYALRQAEDEAESHWLALYDNQEQEEEED